MMNNDEPQVTWRNGPPKRRNMIEGLQGSDAHRMGKLWGQKARTQYSPEEVAGLIRKLAAPKNDHDKGVLEGLTGV